MNGQITRLTQKEIRERAANFAHIWVDAKRESSDKQTFWNDFFNIFGISRRRVATFEEPVKKLGDKRGSIDLLWKGTLVVEQKSKGENLNKAYDQALDYLLGLNEQEHPRYVIVSNFANFRLYDLDEGGKQYNFPLTALPNNIHLFDFISGHTKKIYKDEDPVNIQVAMKMGELHDALLASGYSGHELEVFLVRSVYCLFADDTGIFPKDQFEYLIERNTKEDGLDTGSLIATIFQVLNTRPEERQKTLSEELLQLPYVNGLLFGERLIVPAFNKHMRETLLNCCTYDWSKVSPAIFGSLFQSVMDPARRRSIGAHYTAERNILKVVRGLFLDELYREFETVKNDYRKLKQFHNRIAELRFFDPACGCGNFLVIAYREVRLLEIEVFKQLIKFESKELPLVSTGWTSRIDVDAFYGIESEEFPARIAEVAMWVTDHLMNKQFEREFGTQIDRLPLHKSPYIRNGNALRINWKSFIPKSKIKSTTLYILGNPPFIGKQHRTETQNEDMQLVCADVAGSGVLDYVCAWYVKAAQYIQNTKVKVAFVSTNSISQGEQVGVLWQYLLNKGIKIHFAHRTFRWSSEARGVAQVYCVIIGFAAFDAPVKRLYDYDTPSSEPMEVAAKNINPYLIDADDLVIVNRGKPVCDVPEMMYGSKPTDGGHLLLTDEEKEKLLREEPDARGFIHPLISADELINGRNRWCLWLKDASPTQTRKMPEVMKQVQAVKEFRLSSKKEATRRLADVPYLFGELRQPESDYVVIPLHSSEHRRYVPMGFLTKDAILHNSCSALPNASLYHFGVLTSAMHMAWMRQVCGRLEARYRYSNTLVYNNFPWPENLTDRKQEQVANAAQKVLDARTEFPDASLADLYDPNAMPKKLLDAHKALDAAVDACYCSMGFKTELERLRYLFELYRKYTEPLIQAVKKASKRRKK